jgi:hypothetical protein
MNPAPARRPPAAPARLTREPADARRLERRRRERHFRRRRRDLLEDTGLALAVATVLFIVTAGLGVLALLELPIAALLLLSGIAERLRRRRRPVRQRPRGR